MSQTYLTGELTVIFVVYFFARARVDDPKLRVQVAACFGLKCEGIAASNRWTPPIGLSAERLSQSLVAPSFVPT